MAQDKGKRVYILAKELAVESKELLDYCKVGIANYKVPRRIIFVDDYPRVDGPNGTKILKNKLREMAEAAVASN